MSVLSTKPAVPAKDPLVDRAYDYTKWHIALHGAILVALAAWKADQKFPWWFALAVFFVGVAGVAAGTVASCLSRREYWEGFLVQRTFPLISDRHNVGLTMQTWIHVQHFGLWAAIIIALGGEGIHKFYCHFNSCEPPATSQPHPPAEQKKAGAPGEETQPAPLHPRPGQTRGAREHRDDEDREGAAGVERKELIEGMLYALCDDGVGTLGSGRAHRGVRRSTGGKGAPKLL